MDPGSNITSDLATEVGTADSGRMLDVIVELDRTQGRARDVDAAKEEFSRIAAPVAQVITELGGTVVGGAWINRTLRALVPAREVQAIAKLDHVATVDVPHAIRLE